MQCRVSINKRRCHNFDGTKQIKKKILVTMVGFVVESRGYSDSSIIINQTLRTKFVLSL